MKRTASILLVVAGLWCGPTTLWGQASESLEEAKLLYKEAIELKKAGKIPDAVTAYEKALRKNRGILEADDNGLIAELKKSCESRLASSPEDVTTLETLGFVHAICYSDFEKALEYYRKVLSLAKEEAVKTRTQALIDRLQAQHDMTKLNTSLGDTKVREEKVREWSQMEKQDSMGIVAERIKKREERIRDLSRSKEELETRIPQMEDKLKDMEEEINKADLFYRTTENRMYRRKRERLEGEFATKKQEIEREKRKMDEMGRELDKLQKEAETDQANMGKMPAGNGGEGENGNPPPDDNGNSNPGGSGSGSENPSGGDPNNPNPNPGGDPGGSNPPGDSSNPGGTLPPTGGPNDPALPSNPDFPSDKPPETGSGNSTGSGSSTNWP